MSRSSQGFGSGFEGGELTSRQKLLAAADELAREIGPGHMSLEAVAQRAGVSKGGLLYHFPSKSLLLEALVENHLRELNDALGRPGAGDDAESLLTTYLDLFLREHERRKPPPSGLMAALAENPNLLDPVRAFNRSFLDRITGTSADPAMAMIVFLALEGVRSMDMLNVGVLRPEEFAAVIEKLKSLSAPHKS